MRKISSIFGMILLMASCAGGGKVASADTVSESGDGEISVPAFSADSAMQYLRRQVEFGPRVPGSAAHRAAADWLASELRRHGAEVLEQSASLRAFDGTTLPCRNIFGSFNPEAGDRLLLLAHYDTRPWADQDPDPANHNKPLDGANDGASGVAVLLESARAISASNPGTGIDILFVDAEDYGTDGDESSWAMGTRYFAENPIKPGYTPSRAVLLDMVGGKGAVFPAEYFSRQAAPSLDDAFRAAARQAGYGEQFPNAMGTAVTDDHVELIKVGIPAIDIIDYRQGAGFCPTWHTMADNLDNIDPGTLKAVGESLLQYIYTK